MSGCYSVIIKRSAERELREIPAPDLRRVVTRMRGLTQEPRPSGCEKLSGQEQYRVRQRDYRTVYAVDDQARTIEVVRVGHRREMYRG